jgi:uncharacterized protein
VFRLIRGADCYWAVGQRRIARVPLDSVTEDGVLTPMQAERVRSADLSPVIDHGVYHMTVLVTTSCNLACSYCFQNTAPADLSLRRPPERIPAAALDDDAAAAILAFCERQMTGRGATKLDLMLFGGEPTLYLRQCLNLLAGAAKIGLVHAGMISNATRLGPAAAIALEQAGLRSVQVTLDGDAPVHDRIRVTRGGRGTFEQIMRNLERVAARTSLRFMLRVNLTGESMDSAWELVDRLATRLDPARFGIGFARVNDAGPEFADTIEMSAAQAHVIGKLYKHALDTGFRVGLPTLKPCIACGVVGGGTGSVVNADGTLYSCWESAGKEGYEVGTIADGYLADEVIAPRWVSCGFSGSNPPGTPAFDAFRDVVSADILDWMYDSGRLQRGFAAARGPADDRTQEASAATSVG